MAPAACNPSSDDPARGKGTELWLLRPGTPAELERSLTLFRATPFALVLSPPRADEGAEAGGSDTGDDAGDNDAAGDTEQWAVRFAAAHSAPHVRLPELARAAGGESDANLAERAWPALERALERAHPRFLAVLPGDVLRLCVACAIGYAFARSSALRVDPGRGVLLRDDPIGWVLRRSNALAPQEGTGTALPSGRRKDAH